MAHRRRSSREKSPRKAKTRRAEPASRSSRCAVGAGSCVSTPRDAVHEEGLVLCIEPEQLLRLDLLHLVPRHAQLLGRIGQLCEKVEGEGPVAEYRPRLAAGRERAVEGEQQRVVKVL